MRWPNTAGVVHSIATVAVLTMLDVVLIPIRFPFALVADDGIVSAAIRRLSFDPVDFPRPGHGFGRDRIYFAIGWHRSTKHFLASYVCCAWPASCA